MMEEAISSGENSEEEEEMEEMEVDADDERQLPSLPMEIWVEVFSFLSGPSLFRWKFPTFNVIDTQWVLPIPSPPKNHYFQ